MIPLDDLLTAPGSENVVVKCRRTGEEQQARVDPRGVVRETHGPAAFSKGAYKIVEVEP